MPPSLMSRSWITWPPRWLLLHQGVAGMVVAEAPSSHVAGVAEQKRGVERQGLLRVHRCPSGTSRHVPWRAAVDHPLEVYNLHMDLNQSLGQILVLVKIAEERVWKLAFYTQMSDGRWWLGWLYDMFCLKHGGRRMQMRTLSLYARTSPEPPHRFSLRSCNRPKKKSEVHHKIKVSKTRKWVQANQEQAGERCGAKVRAQSPVFFVQFGANKSRKGIWRSLALKTQKCI